jgi:hypothetical protein
MFITRHYRYRLLRVAQWIRSLPAGLATGLFCFIGRQIWPKQLISGIAVFEPREEVGDEFFRTIHAALDFLQEHDRIRFARVLKEIKVIMDMPTPGGAAYRRIGKMCFVDLRLYPLSSHWEESVILVARDIVHEATHGVLYSRKIIQTRRNHVRVEEVCHRQEMRFGQRIGVQLGGWDQPSQRPPSLRDRLRFIRSELWGTSIRHPPAEAGSTPTEHDSRT